MDGVVDWVPSFIPRTPAKILVTIIGLSIIGSLFQQVRTNGMDRELSAQLCLAGPVDCGISGGDWSHRLHSVSVLDKK